MATKDETEDLTCPSAADELKRLTSELADFEARKIPEVKRELEAFVKKQETALEDYKKEYKGLRQQWCDQQGAIERLDAAIKRAFPDDSWKKIITECICVPERTIYCLQQSIDARKQCCQGKLERKVWEAQRGFQTAKVQLDALTANVAGRKAALGANGKSIDDVNKLLGGPDKALAFYPFFFELIPAHAKVAPDDLTPFGVGVSPAELCKDTWTACPTDDAPCTPPSGAGTSATAAVLRSAPWLVHPDKYSYQLDCAWRAFHEAKDDLTQAEADYKAAPDDLASREKQLPEAKKKAAEDIKICLTSKTPDDPCPKPSATA